MPDLDGDRCVPAVQSRRRQPGSHRLDVGAWIGRRFGHLVVTGHGGRDRWGRTLVTCRCDCGRDKIVGPWHLRGWGSSHVTSCGRCGVQQAAARARARTHGQSGTPDYQVWLMMVARCERATAAGFVMTGGQAVQVCERWRHDFPTFMADMGPRPRHHTIARLDLSRGFEPGNCVWSPSRSWQLRSFAGQPIYHAGQLCRIGDLAAAAGLRPAQVVNRLARGWFLEAALSPEPPERRTSNRLARQQARERNAEKELTKCRNILRG